MANNKRIIVSLVVLGLLLVSLIGISYGNSAKEQQLFIQASSDKVDISLTLSSKRKKPILPQISLPIDIKITNEGIPCYVRFKLVIDGMVKNELIQGLAKVWVIKDDGYIYLNYPLKEHEVISLFDSIYLDEALFVEKKKALNIMIFADAIQSKHFTLELNKDNPWKDVVIEKAIVKRMGGDSE